MSEISWKDFEKVEIRVGTIQKVEIFEEAIKPAYKIWVDFGKIGIKKSSAQLTVNYRATELIGKQVVCVTNFKPKQIGPFMSEVLITGFPDENQNTVIVSPMALVPNGARLY